MPTDYVVTFPDFGYGVTQGETDAEAMEMAQDLLMLTIGDYIKESRGVGSEEGGPCPSDRDSEDPHRTLIFSPAPLPPESNRSGLCRARQAFARRGAERGLRAPDNPSSLNNPAAHGPLERGERPSGARVDPA